MAIQIGDGGDKNPKIGADAPATIDCVPVEASQTQEKSLPQEQMAGKIGTSDKIVSNSVSIDVMAARSQHNESYYTAVGSGEKRVSFESGTGGKKSDNAITRYFKSKTEGLSRTQLAILCIFPFVEFFAATVISIQGPFYPDTARKKGASPSEYGCVFGSFELVVFIMAPIYGMKMGKLNPHRLFNYGIFTTSLTCFLFGFVHHIEGRVAFILTSLIIRVVEAIGDAAFVIASFSIIAVEFPDSVATTFAMMETFYGLGMIAGPTVGGALFEVGGFTLPFATMGVLLFITAIATYNFITRVTDSTDVEKPVGVYGFNMFKMLKIPVILLTAYGTFAAATGIGFLSNNLEHHLEEFQLDKFKVGCIFMLNGGVYALSAPLWGRLCDKTKQLKIYSLIGAVLTIVGFALVGPIPFVPSWDSSIPVICLGLVIFGLGLGSTLVSAFVQFLTDALANGYPDDVSTYGLVSGLWTSMTALGFFVGPTIGGFLDHAVGFRWGTLFIYVEQIILILLLIRFFLQSPDSALEKKNAAQDKMDDIVITYAVKMNTPKPKSRKGDASQPTNNKEQTTNYNNNYSSTGMNAATTNNANIISHDSPTAPNAAAENSDNSTTTQNHATPVVTSSPPTSQQTSETTPIVSEHAKEEEQASSEKMNSGQENPSFVGDHQ